MQVFRKVSTIIAGSTLALLAAQSGLAETPDGFENMSPDERRAYVQSLSDEDRKAFVVQRQERWDAMSEDERSAERKSRNAQRDADRKAQQARWKAMSEEERDVARAERKVQQDKQRELWDNMSEEEKNAARQLMRENRGSQSRGQGGRAKDNNRQ